MDLQEFLKEVNLPESIIEECGGAEEMDAHGNSKKTHIVIDLGMAQKGLLNETLFGAFAGITKWLLKTTMGINLDKWAVPVRFSGSRSQLGAFEKAFKGERRHWRTAKKHGLDDPKTYQSKYRLDRAVRNFESSTGIKWPIGS